MSLPDLQPNEWFVFDGDGKLPEIKQQTTELQPKKLGHIGEEGYLIMISGSESYYDTHTPGDFIELNVALVAQNTWQVGLIEKDTDKLVGVFEPGRSCEILAGIFHAPNFYMDYHFENIDGDTCDDDDCPLDYAHDLQAVEYELPLPYDFDTVSGVMGTLIEDTMHAGDAVYLFSNPPKTDAQNEISDELRDTLDDFEYKHYDENGNLVETDESQQ